MSRMPRKLVLDETDVGVFHCINRCVRRAFLCGTDSVIRQQAGTGNGATHNLAWHLQKMALENRPGRCVVR